MPVSLYLKVHSSDILLREQFLNVSLAPVGLNFLVLEDYEEKCQPQSEVVRTASESEIEREAGKEGEK